MSKIKKLTPEDLQTGNEFELLEEVSHKDLKEFIMEQIRKDKLIIRVYSIYQIAIMLLFTFFFTRSIVYFFKGNSEYLVWTGASILFSFSFLIVIHELLHALAYIFTGSRNISFGFIPKKFIFYALADRQVIGSKAFHVVALTPLVTVKIICLAGIVLFYGEVFSYFFLSIMCLHSLFCAGDVAMLAFYNLHNDKEIYNFDVRSEGKTYFYARRVEQNKY
jgi:hypothetical protein